MASRIPKPEGIASLSIYMDEDMDDIDDEEEEEEPEQGYRETTDVEEEEEKDDTTALDGIEATRKLDAINRTPFESETASDLDVAVNLTEENFDNLLAKFLPPPPKVNCSEDLQKKIDKFLALKKIGRSFNAEVRNRKAYRNPDFLLHAVRYQDIDQIGSCLSEDVFNPHGYDKSDYYDEIEADMKSERERREQENRRNQRIDFVSGGSQSGVLPAIPKPCIQVSGLSASVSSGFPSIPTKIATVSHEGRQNKKSKWDKVDDDQRHALTSVGEDSVPSVKAHAAALPAVNACAGYTAFM